MMNMLKLAIYLMLGVPVVTQLFLLLSPLQKEQLWPDDGRPASAAYSYLPVDYTYAIRVAGPQ